ncbi:MAG: amidohydrolase [Candidatus Aminicenantes bacterium]|nr:amidohydrolase [Candidatus Aminicenantes bacterium]
MTRKKNFSFCFIGLFFIIGFFACAQAPKQSADLVLLNGKIITVDDTKPTAEALAVLKDRLLAVGSSMEIKPYITAATRVIDLEGKLAVPGFIDAHGHFLSLGYAKMRLDLTKAKNWEHIVEIVADAVKKAKPGEWIYGRGWHQEKWDKTPQPNVAGLPVHHALSSISPHNPVVLTHASGHSSIINAKAMELAGITAKTPNPAGGEIIKDAAGQPIGTLLETAQDLLDLSQALYRSSRSAGQIEEELLKAIELAAQECLCRGVTSFHDAGTSFSTIDLYRRLAQEKKLRVRLNAMIGENNGQLRQHLAKYRIIGMGDHHLTVRSIKRLIDGALGSHGAWLLEPYDSLPGSLGLNTEPVETMKETAAIAIENDFQLCTHAIGDRANRETLNIYEEMFKRRPEKKDLRWRIEHAQHLHPDDIPRFARLGVIASMQGVHCTSDGPWVIKRLGEKRSGEGAYVWQKLMKAGTLICNGTDVPVEAIDPIACFYASVTRKLKDGSYFYPDQKMSRLEALRSYTLNGAYADFEEAIKGSLTPGKLADITILSKDITTVPDDEILETKVLYTIVGGEIMYQAAK